MTATIGLRELRQSASEYVRRVENGERITVTVAGRPAAQLVPVTGPTWTPLNTVLDVLGGPPLQAWDREVPEELVDPWAAEQ
jgi:prevent-host-death family protein